MANIPTESSRARMKDAPKPAERREPSLKGTFASVMLLGGFLLLSWLSVFVLYLVRN